MHDKKLLERKKYEEWVCHAPKSKCLLCAWQNYQVAIENFDNWVWILAIAPYWKYHSMLVPHRHLEDFSDLNEAELTELDGLTERIEKSYVRLVQDLRDDSIPHNVLFFWRKRYVINEDRNNLSNQHFHLHISPDKDHSWEPVLDDKACEIDLDRTVRLLRF